MYLIIDITCEEQLSIAQFDNKLQVHMTQHSAGDALGWGQRDSTGEYDIVELTSARGGLAICWSILHMEERIKRSQEHGFLCEQDHQCHEQDMEYLASLKLLQGAWLHADAKRKAKIDARNEAAVDAYDPNHGCDGVF